GNDMSELFKDLTENLSQISQPGEEFDVAWKDEDGDSVVITRPVELGEAIEARKDATLRLHSLEKKVKKTDSKPDSETPQQIKQETNTLPDGALHKDVLCDVCDAVVIGTRYRCLLCVDYDLCERCERT
ncbi:zinc finger, ZZ type, partial [Teladorsagia circumcincta]